MIFIYLEIAFVVLLSWAVGGMLLRGLRRERDAAKALAVRRNEALRDAKAQLRDAQLAIAQLQKQLDDGGEDAVDINSALIEFEQDFSSDANALGELDSIHGQWLDSVNRLEKGSTPESPLSYELQLKELTLLREQHARSGAVINMLSKALERNRERVRTLEKNAPRRTGDGAATAELEAGYRRLAHENKSMHVRMQKATEQHQGALERISNQLRKSEEKYRVHVNEAKERQEKMQSVIDHLREQLRAADGQQMDAARVDELLARVQEMDDALAQALRERDFLDERYIEIEQALSASESAAQELERTRVEYRMLEERYLEMEEKIYKKVAVERKRTEIAAVSTEQYREKGIDVIPDDMADLL